MEQLIATTVFSLLLHIQHQKWRLKLQIQQNEEE